MSLEQRLLSNPIPISDTFGNIIFSNPKDSKKRFAQRLNLTLQAISVSLLALSYSQEPASANEASNTSAPLDPSTKILYAVSDVMYKGLEENADKVGRLLEKSLAATVGYSKAIIPGDLCNDDGEQECYDRLDQSAWGPLRPLYYALMGNHDNLPARNTPGRMAYFWNYALNAGEREKGYHAFDWGGWRIILLNTELMAKNTLNKLSTAGLEQMAWYESELKQHAKDKCVLVSFHRPPFSSGLNAGTNGSLGSWVDAIFRKSYKHGVDLYVAGHEHFFAAMPPLTPFHDKNGIAIVDLSYGVPGFIVGTGGAIFFPHPTRDPRIKKENRSLKWVDYGERVLANELGILELKLKPGSYSWRFIPEDPRPGYPYPSGSGTCHGNPTNYTEPALS